MPPSESVPFGAIFAIVVGLFLVGWRVILWVRDSETTADPWDADTQTALNAPDAVAVCHHCLSPQPYHVRFCAECGSSIGPYNNLLPYVYIFSMGEGFRAGTSGTYRVSPLTVCGFLLGSTSQYSIFAPIYWFFLARNLDRLCQSAHPPDISDQSACV